MEELLHNHNTLTKNALGHAERSSHKANLVAGGCLGALIVKDLVTGVVFNIGSGFTQAQREDLWMVRDELLNTVVKYKYFPTGVKDKPRFPTYIGPRAKADT
jgi:DNA ligase-1